MFLFWSSGWKNDWKRGSFTMVGSGIIHGFGTDPIKNPTIWLVEGQNQVN